METGQRTGAAHPLWACETGGADTPKSAQARLSLSKRPLCRASLNFPFLPQRWPQTPSGGTTSIGPAAHCAAGARGGGQGREGTRPVSCRCLPQSRLPWMNPEICGQSTFAERGTGEDAGDGAAKGSRGAHLRTTSLEGKGETKGTAPSRGCRGSSGSPPCCFAGGVSVRG